MIINLLEGTRAIREHRQRKVRVMASGPIRTLLGGFEKLSSDGMRRLVLDTASRLIEAPEAD
jgi:hypothetical protein